MGEISLKIDEILAIRRNRASVLALARERCNAAHDAVSAFRDFQVNTLNNTRLSNAKGEVEIAERLSSVSTDEFFNLYQKYSTELNRLTERLNRKSLNISFVGRAGQGKSLVMQRISGLDASVIPSSVGGDCTGAKSIITNSDVSEVSAEITFFSEMEMIEIINKYLMEITHGSVSIGAVSQIKTLDLDKISSTLNFADVNENVYLQTLRKYVEHYDEYSGHYGCTLPVREENIEEYVAQYKHNNPDHRYYKYLGVKLADIKCRFPHEDAGSIVLVDTIGIGAVSLGTEEAMKEAIANDSDAIIFLFRPDVFRQRYSNDERDIITMISESVSPEYAKEMLFWVINCVRTGDGVNVGGIPSLVQEIEDLEKHDKMPIAGVIAVDCNSSDEVENNLLIPVLNQLAGRITTVDNRLIEKLNIIGNQFYKAYNHICLATDQVFASTANSDMKHKFEGRIQSTFRISVLNQIRELYLHKYKNLRRHACDELAIAAQEKLHNIFLCVPDREDILKILSHGDVNQFNAYEICTDRMRMSIIDDFNKLNVVLEHIIEGMKQEVIHIFTDEEYGRLGYVFGTDSGDSSQWILGFIEMIDGEKNYPRLTSALKQFNAYTINVQGFLIHEIRDQLDGLDVSLSGLPKLTAPMDNKDNVADEIIGWLNKIAQDTHDSIEVAMQELYKAPNRSMFAAIKDLYDRMTYAGSDDADADSVRTEWRYLYEDWMHLVWKEDYQRESAFRVIAEEWNGVIERLKGQNKVDNFLIGKG